MEFDKVNDFREKLYKDFDKSDKEKLNKLFGGNKEELKYLESCLFIIYLLLDDWFEK